MKAINIIAALLFLGTNLFAQTVNSQLFISKNDSHKWKVTPKVSLETSAAKMGNATLKISYDKNVFNLPDNIVEEKDFTVHNFSGGDYYPIKIVKTREGLISINISYKMGSGTNLSNEAMKIATIYFEVNSDETADQSHFNWELAEFFSPGSFHQWELGDLTKNLVTNQNDESPETVKEYRLFGNYPNPFNPSTTIKYHIPYSSKLTITVYDILGRKVTELFSGIKSRGYHKITWNASKAASGNYFLRLSAKAENGEKNFKEVKKMTLLK